MRLADKSIVVTGATGVAAAGARRASAEGARIFVISLDEDDCRALVSSIEGEGGVASYAVADLTVEPGPGYPRYLPGPAGVYCVARNAESGRRPGRGTRTQGRITVNPVKSTFQLEPVS